MGKRSLASETQRVRRIWERLAPRYDKDIKLFEKLLFSGGREWVSSRTKGEVLEIAAGTGRNLEHYPPDVRLTSIDLSASMLDVARRSGVSAATVSNVLHGTAPVAATTRLRARGTLGSWASSAEPRSGPADSTEGDNRDR